MLGRCVSRRKAGFTLIELVVTLAIMAIVAVLGLPALGTWMLNSQIRTAAESVQNGLQMARNEAVRRNSNVEFILGAGSAWTVRMANAGAVIQTRESGEGSKSVVLAPTPAGATTLTFDSLGRVVANADATPSLTQVGIDLPSAVLGAAETRELTLIVGTGGQIRMCDPNVSDTNDPRKCAI